MITHISNSSRGLVYIEKAKDKITGLGNFVRLIVFRELTLPFREITNNYSILG